MICSEPHRLSVLAFLLFSIAVFYFIVVVIPWSSDSLKDGCSTGCRAVDSLRLITVVSRHGNRGCPLDYPGDPYPSRNKTYWPYEPSELTPYGRVQMFNLGEKLRNLYSGFLPDLYNPQDLKASSSSMDRLLMSGESFLAGLYPPRGFQVWNPDLNWQPIPLYSDSLDKTKIAWLSLLADKSEYGQGKMLNKWFQSLTNSVFEKLISKYVEDALKSLLKNVQTYSAPLATISRHVMDATGVNMTGNYLRVFAMWDKLSSEVTEGFQIPEWTNDIYPNPLDEIAAGQYKRAFGGTDTVTRLLLGQMFEQMLDVMIQKGNGSLTPDRKILYYSGHDSSIIGLQRILGIPMDSMVGAVKPASALIIELHKDATTNQHYLQIVYINGGDPDKHKILPLPDNSFETLVKNAQNFIHVNYTEECLNTTFHLPKVLPEQLFDGSFYYLI